MKIIKKIKDAIRRWADPYGDDYPPVRSWVAVEAKYDWRPGLDLHK